MKLRLRRIGKIVAVSLVVVELAWLLIANGVLASGIIQKLASEHPDKVKMEWDRAFSPWPGRAYVRNFRLRLQDSTVQFRLTVAHAHVDVHVFDLLHREFHGSHVVADGVTYRLAVKTDHPKENAARLAAYPPIQGFSQPPLKPHPEPPKDTPEELEQLWSVQLEDCDASVDELWFLEYRYQGPARATGSFELKPLRWLWVDGKLALDRGRLSLGRKVVDPAFSMQLETDLRPINLQENEDEHVLRTLNAHARFDTHVRDASVIDAYIPGLKAHGAVHVIADVSSRWGRLSPGSTVDVKVNSGTVDYKKWHFIGHGEANLSVAGETPIIRSNVEGQLGVPLLKGEPPIEASVESFKGELKLADGHFSEGLHLGVLHAETEAKVDDTRALTQAFGDKVPLVGKLVLGDGPLTAIGSAHVTPQYKLVRVRRLELGHAQLEGALRNGPNGWTGAASGRFSALPLGFRLRDNKVSPVPFVSKQWLDGELTKEGIRP